MINIKELYNSAYSTEEGFELTFKASDFSDPYIEGDIQIKGKLLRIEEGVMMMIDELTFTQKGKCVKCAKAQKQKITTKDSEWLYYDKRPNDFDDHNEFLQIQMKTFSIDPKDVIRQELVLNENPNLQCETECNSFESGPSGVKALAGLKDLLGD